MRLPARSVKLGPKLERCHSAIQRSESVKCANPPRTEFLVAPVMWPENATSSRKSWWARAERAQPPAARRTCSSQGWRRRGSTFGLAGPRRQRSRARRTRRRRGSRQLAAGPSGGRSPNSHWVPRCEEPASGQQPALGTVTVTLAVPTLGTVSVAAY